MPRGVAPYILVMDTSADGLKAAAPRTKPAYAGWGGVVLYAQQGATMTTAIAAHEFTTALFDIFEETFERVQGIYLDRGTSLFETLATISAAEASQPVGTHCASIAAQVEHVIYYLEVLDHDLQHKQPQNVDWSAAWQHQTVDEAAWAERVQRLQAMYAQVMAHLRAVEVWQGDSTLGAALALVVHTAYHLGEIRQALCTVKPDR